MYGYEWTDEYGIYRLTKETKVQKEIRPVFKEELDYFHMYEYWDYPETEAPLLWAEGVRRYVLNGKCIAEAKGGGFYTKPTINRLVDERLQLKPINIDRLYEVNLSIMKTLEHMSISFIREQYERFSQSRYYFICAFSGGKDSIVLLDLVAKALAPDEFFVMFSNTGMELSDTLKAVEAAKMHWPDVKFYEAKCEFKAEESWDEFGPPGRRLRWCCAVHKSIPTILKIREVTKSYNAKAVVYDGVRAEESARRAKYDEVSIGAKNINQINVSPIHKWNTAELYCYLLKNHLLMNKAYRIGLFRVGCMVCPLSSEWWDGIANDVYHEEMEPLLQRVENYAKANKPAKEIKKYIEDGGWKARMGGRGLPNGGNRVAEVIENNSITFTIANPVQRWIDVAQILGAVIEEEERSIVQRIDGIDYQGFINNRDDVLTVTYRPFSKMNRFTISHLRGIANKVAYCIGCKACTVQCPTGAFTIQPNGRILVRSDLCIHCSNCLSFSEKSCLLARSLSTTQGGSRMDMKGMNAYQHFGLRQAWLEHFMNEGINCFGMGMLGTRQYDALKVWLKECEIIETNKDKSLQITPLGQKLMEFGPYNPFTWAVIWANLSYNSVICKWYCLNAELGYKYEKGDLVTMIGETYSKSTRDNAVTSLLETMRFSPIGSSLNQGIPLPKTASTYSYLREGWSVPDGVAILYSLYLYAEHTGRRKFTLTELVQAHDNPDAKGISPADIYGIEPKAFRDVLQGLALTYRDQIRVSFINDLDNIVLDDNTSSLDVLALAEE